MPTDIVTPQQLAALKTEIGFDDSDVDDDTADDADIEAGQAIANAVLYALPGTEAAELDRAVGEASGNVQAYIRDDEARTWLEGPAQARAIASALGI